MQLGRYNLLHRIAAGGMAEVWKAKALGASTFEKTVAIKRLLPTLSQKPDVIRMFIEEAQMVANLTHPNIVHVFDFGQTDDGRYFIAMEYVPGVDLGALQRLRALPMEVALFVVAEACKALGHAHARGIIHRDVSPRNLLVSFDGELKVTDFGIAKVITHLNEDTMPGILKGKPPYMSPEQVRQLPLDPRSDLFSLATVLYELVVGTRLFSGSPNAVFGQILSYEGPPEELLAPLPMDVRDVLETGLHPDPDRRYQSALELESAVLSVVETRGLVEARTTLARMAREAAGVADTNPEQPARDVPTLDTAPSVEPDETGTIIQKKPVSDVEASGSWHTATAAVDGPRAPRPRLQPAAVPKPPVEAPRPPSAPSRPSAWPLRIAVAAVLVLAGLLVLRETMQPGGVVSATPQSQPSSAPSGKATDPPERTTPTVVSTRDVVATHVATPTRRPTVPPAAPASLRVTSNKSWVRVRLDGEVIVDETPASGVRIPPGKHVLTFENPAWDLKVEYPVQIQGNQSLHLFVNVDAGTVERR